MANIIVVILHTMLLFYFLVLKNDEHKLLLHQTIIILQYYKGSSKGLTPSIPIGGHCAPNSTLGEIELWKKAQNMAKRKIPQNYK